MREDVSRILKMVEEGKLDSQKAGELIEALNTGKAPEHYIEAPQEPRIPLEPEIPQAIDGMMLKIRVRDSKDNVNIQLPIKFIKGVLKAVGKIPVNVEGMENVDLNLISQAIDNGLTGKIVDIQSEKGETVEILIE